MTDDEYQRLATATYDEVNAQAASRLLASERLLVAEIERRGDTAMTFRMRNAYARLVLVGRMGMAAYAE
jgi:muconolactone delta-isomerase